MTVNPDFDILPSEDDAILAEWFKSSAPLIIKKLTALFQSDWENKTNPQELRCYSCAPLENDTLKSQNNFSMVN